MTSDLQPLFLFSLPRSGSTLSQRILGADPRIATASEPWILLPLLYAQRREGIYAEYWHQSAADAIDDFCATMSGGSDVYRAEVRQLALRLYARASAQRWPDARYFLDKTPRYSLITDDIIRTFPDGKFLFLWRNPLAVIASVIQTWGNGRWYLFRLNVDLYAGLERMLAAYEEYRVCSFAFRYEDMLADPAAVWTAVFAYLELDFDPTILQRFPETQLEGRMGDKVPGGSTGLNAEPLEKWKDVLASPLRKFWCARYLRWIGSDRLALMGYDLQLLLRDLRRLQNRPQNILSDLLWATSGSVYDALEISQFRRRLRNHSQHRRNYPHL